MHLMLTDELSLDRTKGACPDMKGHIQHIYPSLSELGKDLGGEVQPCRRSCHRSLSLGVDCLIGDEVTSLGLSVQVRRDRKDPHELQQFAEGIVGVVPAEGHLALTDTLGL